MTNKVLIKGTFLDEISHDIPHQNWGEKEWSLDFKNMKSVGIDKVILIRCGYKGWITYPSKVLTMEEKTICISKDGNTAYVGGYYNIENMGDTDLYQIDISSLQLISK